MPFANPAVAPALISGASSLVGGLLGRNKEKPPSSGDQRRHARKLEKGRYKWLRRGAKKAGFNPLTVLGAAGQSSGQGQLDYTPSPLGWKAALGDAISAAGQTYASIDPVAVEGAKLDNQLKQRQIAAFDAEVGRHGSAGGQTSTQPVRQYDHWGDHDLPNYGNGHVRDPHTTPFPVVDIGSIDPERARVTHGPFSGRYIVNVEGKNYALPESTPTAVFEELTGAVSGEGAGAIKAMSALAQHWLGQGLRVTVNTGGANAGGEVFPYLRPRGRFNPPGAMPSDPAGPKISNTWQDEERKSPDLPISITPPHRRVVSPYRLGRQINQTFN